MPRDTIQTAPSLLSLYFGDIATQPIASAEKMTVWARQLQQQREAVIADLCEIPKTFEILAEWRETKLKDNSIYDIVDKDINKTTSKTKNDTGEEDQLRTKTISLVTSILESHESFQEARAAGQSGDTEKGKLQQLLLSLHLTIPMREALIDAAVYSTTSQNLRISRRAFDSTRKRMINANLRLIVTLAKKARRTGLSFEDIIQEGNIGLMKAVEKFNPERGIKFSSYAKWWFRHALERLYENQSSTIRLPMHIRQQSTKIVRASEKLEIQFGRQATADEIGAETRINADRVDFLLSAAIVGGQLPSLDAPINQEEDKASYIETLADSSPNPHEIISCTQETEQYKTHMHKLLSAAKLTDREFDIITLYHLDPNEENTLNSIGQEFGLSGERIRQLAKTAYKKIKTAAEERGKEYPALIFQGH